MNNDLVVRNARLVLGEEVIHGSLAIAGGIIAAIDHGGCSVPAAADLEGDLLIPGLVELHTDNLERHLTPRPKVRWPELPALLAHDAEVASAGITTVFDALGVGDPDPETVRGQAWSSLLACIERSAREGLLRADHHLHVRCELPAPNTVQLFAPFVNHPRVSLISLMDHTPGQRQWENIEQARTYYTGKRGWSDARFDQQVAQSAALQQAYAEPHRRHFIAYARDQHIALASHDDTTADHVLQALGGGASISEFPTTVAAARAARQHRLSVVMGAPNVVRGGSHSGNVAAAELARLDLLDSLSSDYVPSSLLLAAFMLIDQIGFSMPKALATVSRNPAASVGMHDRGEIAIGKRADLVQLRLVAQPGGPSQPFVVGVWRAGRRVI